MAYEHDVCDKLVNSKGIMMVDWNGRGQRGTEMNDKSTCADGREGVVKVTIEGRGLTRVAEVSLEMAYDDTEMVLLDRAYCELE